MMDQNQNQGGNGQGCPLPDELYRFVALPPDENARIDIQEHLSVCPTCRKELAEVLKLLYPEHGVPEEPEPVISDAEIEQTLSLIQEVARKEAAPKARPWWLRRAVAAAAAVALCASGAIGYWLYQVHQSTQYFNGAVAELERVYSGSSPSGLRLNLPFQASAALRASGGASLQQAKTGFSTALALRSGLSEAHLGLAAIYMTESQYSDARNEFQRVLDANGDDVRARVGRGVSLYELSRQSLDPIERGALLKDALADFDAAVKLDASSLEARFDRIMGLYEAGRHREALAAIDDYLARDPDSRWSGELKTLRDQIRLSKNQEAEKQAEQASVARDEAALKSIVRLIPARMPPVIRALIRKSLQVEGRPAMPGAAGAADLMWAAAALEKEYRSVTGDGSCQAMLAFCAGLPPGKRRLKASLDRELMRRADLLNDRQADVALRGSEELERGYSSIRDLWQLAFVHSLRGNCYYWQADFKRTEAEYLKMHDIAEQVGNLELLVKSYAGLAAAYGELDRMDDLKEVAGKLAALAQRYSLEEWSAVAAMAEGGRHGKLNQPEESLEDFSRALGFVYRNQDDTRLVHIMQILVPILMNQGRQQEAMGLCSECLERIAAITAEAGEKRRTEIEGSLLNIMYRQGVTALETGDPERAESWFLQGLRGPVSGMLELECRLRLGLAQAYFKERRITDAEQQVGLSLKLADEGKYEELQWRARFLKGEMSKAAGDGAHALTHFNYCVDMLEGMRGRISSAEMRQLFLTRRFDPYREVVSLLYETKHDGTGAAEFAGRAKSMTLREYLDGQGTEGDSGTADVAQNLDAVAIDYFFAARGLFAFVTRPGGSLAVPLGHSRSELGQDVQDYVKGIVAGDGKLTEVLSRRLYDRLIDPVLRRTGPLSQGRLVIFPDGPLCLLPFAGLKDAEGKFLLERYVISYAPSRSVLRHCMALKRGNAATGDRQILLVGGGTNLQGADGELNMLSKLYGQSARFLTARNVAAAADLASAAEIIHFAGHAALENGKPALMLQDPPHEVRLESGQIESWRLRRNGLVTLAGCETGIGPQAEGEIPWGLIPAFLNAGAPALIVTLLPVDDAATGRLTSRFYEAMFSGHLPKAEALRQAQLSLLKSAGDGRTNLLTWAPYVLIGDPR